MTPDVFDDTACELGEGPLWHPKRNQFFWFDIKGKRLLTRTEEGRSHWQFGEHVSAAGWIDEDSVLMASETALSRFTLSTGQTEKLCPLEADKPLTRSNDGRADPWGGFWIGTMGLQAEKGAGAIYRYYKGELRRLYGDIAVPNSICFSPDGLFAYFCDTDVGMINRQPLEQANGWPQGDPEPFIDGAARGIRPDGSVVDAEGNLWNAEYGGGRVTCYGPDGALKESFDLPAVNTTCPAFGGDDLRDLYVTSATQKMTDEERASQPMAGNTFILRGMAMGYGEHAVLI